MTEPAINIDQSIVEGIVTKAIIESITPEARDQLLAGAVSHLMGQPDYNSRAYNDKRNRLQIAFGDAVAVVAERLAREQLEADPRLREAIQGMIDPMIAGVLDEDYADTYKQAMGRALVEAIKKRD